MLRYTMKMLLLIITVLLTGIRLFAQTNTELKTVDLQKPIVVFVAKNFPGFNIDHAFKTDSRGAINYTLCLTKATVHYKLTFDKDGKFLRNHPCSGDCCKDKFKK